MSSCSSLSRDIPVSFGELIADLDLPLRNAFEWSSVNADLSRRESVGIFHDAEAISRRIEFDVDNLASGGKLTGMIDSGNQRKLIPGLLLAGKQIMLEQQREHEEGGRKKQASEHDRLHKENEAAKETESKNHFFGDGLGDLLECRSPLAKLSEAISESLSFAPTHSHSRQNVWDGVIESMTSLSGIEKIAPMSSPNMPKTHEMALGA